jgi:hypothetical protein
MRRISGATLSVVGGVVGALVVAGSAATGCGGDDTTPPNNNSSSSTGSTTTTGSNSNSSSTSTSGSGSGSSSTSSSSSTSTSGVDGGDGGDGGPTPCNTITLLGLADSGTLLFSFDDGGSNPSWTGQVLTADPLDAGDGSALKFDATVNTTIGASCPGSIELSTAFTQLGQKGQGYAAYASPPGLGVTGTAVHFALKMIATNSADGGPVAPSELVIVDGGGFSYMQAFAQWAPPLADGAAPDASYVMNDFFNIPNGFGAFPADGGWVLEAVPIKVADPGDGAVSNATTPTLIYLNQIGLVLADPQIAADGGPMQLPYPVTVKFYADDIYVK